MLILHTGRLYNGQGNYKSKKVKFIGTNKLGFHIGIWKYLFKYDIVVASYNLRIITCWLPVFFKKKFVFWGKGLGSNEVALIKYLRHLTARKADRILVYNEAKKQEFLDKIKIDEEKIIAYTNTIYISNSGYEIKENRDYFLYFGRIQARKGLDELIDHYSLYVKKEEGELLKFRFVGNGEYIDKLKSKVSELQLNHLIEFYPGVYDDISIKKHFANAVAYVSPFNVGLGIVNSLAYGVPIVTCKEPQVGPEFYYLNNQNSLVINDVSELSDTFIFLSNNNNQELFSNCYSYFKNNLDSNIMYDNFINTIKKVWNE